jgi:hypothetical protein
MISGAHAMAAQFLGLPVIAVASRTPEKSAERAKQLNAKSVEYAQLPSGANIVVIATPPAQHFDHAIFSKPIDCVQKHNKTGKRFCTPKIWHTHQSFMPSSNAQ